MGMGMDIWRQKLWGWGHTGGSHGDRVGEQLVISS